MQTQFFTGLRIDMALLDRHVLEFLRSRADATGRVRLKHSEISEAIGCHVNTAKVSTNRLQSAGQIKKRDHSRAGVEIEVIASV